MELQLKNIGMLKEANVKIDGLTVIAGENDTGKSTVGKALLSVLYNYKKREELLNKNQNTKVVKYHRNVFKNLMKFSLNKNSEINVKQDNQLFIKYSYDNVTINNNTKFIRAIMIETPIIMNFYEFFSRISIAQEEVEYDISNYPYTFKLLYKRLSLPLKNRNKNSLGNIISNIIKGSFKIEKDNIIFYRQDEKFDVNSVATGIKSFGILQLLAKNGYLKKGNVLILDEPEVHLHPKWQLEMAKVIIELVKNEVKVLVTSHSPYMIEALELYSKKEKVSRNFYLAEKEEKFAYIKDVTNNLEPIYFKLAEPINDLEEQSLENFEW